MKKKHVRVYCIILLLGIASTVYGQEESFGFDEKQENSELFKIDIGGKFSTGMAFFLHQQKKMNEFRPTSLIKTDLHVSAESPLTKAYFGVYLSDKTLATTLGEQNKYKTFPQNKQIPSWIDEAYLDIIFDHIIFSGGIQKLTWGRSEHASILDVINPLDNSDLTIVFLQERKVARPLFHFQLYAPFDIKCEALFLPNFEGHRFALGGRWKPSHFYRMEQSLKQAAVPSIPTSADTQTLQYAQAGSRVSGTIGTVHDLGIQYFYGRLKDGALRIDHTNHSASIVYNPYHHIGMDYGTVFGPIGIQLECAANITEDIVGDDPFVYNPFLSWNTTIEYAAPFGFAITATAVEDITLNHKHIGIKQFDIQKGQKLTHTMLIITLAQSLLRHSLQWHINASIGIEDADFCIRPGIHWQYGTLLIDCQFGLFGGSRKGKQGHFYNNNFMYLSFGYAF